MTWLIAAAIAAAYLAGFAVTGRRIGREFGEPGLAAAWALLWPVILLMTGAGLALRRLFGVRP